MQKAQFGLFRIGSGTSSSAALVTSYVPGARDAAHILSLL